ncbi:MAG: hypothetical protein E6344_15265 [Clostridium sp.]|nr:hypothetical protein [Clostridium sp.]MDU7085053.1 hypothetical protein [Clostridium sp.]
MNWKECFEKNGYKPLIKYTENDIATLDIDFFLHNGEVPHQLREVYLSKHRDELFLVLQPDDGQDIKKFCENWDDNIMAFINFGSIPGEGRESISNLRYNIVQVILFGIGSNKNGIKYMEEPSDFSEEKSTSVSRKIFIKSNNEDEFDDESKLLLPFWYEEFERAPENTELEEELGNLLPDKNKVVTLYNEHEKIDSRKKGNTKSDFSYSEEEFQIIRGWLEQ